MTTVDWIGIIVAIIGGVLAGYKLISSAFDKRDKKLDKLTGLYNNHESRISLIERSALKKFSEK